MSTGATNHIWPGLDLRSPSSTRGFARRWNSVTAEPALFMVNAIRPQFRFQIHEGGGNWRRRRTRERAPAGHSKGGTSWGANSTEGGAGVHSDRQEGRVAWAQEQQTILYMTGARSAFSELDSGICETMKFGDGSVVEIKGLGTILFISKGDEHRKLTDVYFIPRLKANLVSLGQLDEAGCFISIERGLLKICDNR